MLSPLNIPGVTDQPFWWLSTGFGKLIFLLFFVTWGLVVIDLALVALWFIRDLFGKKVRGKKRSNWHSKN